MLLVVEVKLLLVISKGFVSPNGRRSPRFVFTVHLSILQGNCDSIYPVEETIRKEDIELVKSGIKEFEKEKILRLRFKIKFV